MEIQQKTKQPVVTVMKVEEWPEGWTVQGRRLLEETTARRVGDTRWHMRSTLRRVELTSRHVQCKRRIVRWGVDRELRAGGDNGEVRAGLGRPEVSRLKIYQNLFKNQGRSGLLHGGWWAVSGGRPKGEGGEQPRATT